MVTQILRAARHSPECAVRIAALVLTVLAVIACLTMAVVTLA